MLKSLRKGSLDDISVHRHYEVGSEFFPVYALRIYYYISVQHIVRWYLEQSRTQYSPNEVKVAIRRTGILTNPKDLCMYCTLLQD